MNPPPPYPVLHNIWAAPNKRQRPKCGNVNMNTSVADENVDDLKTYLYNVTANDVIASTVKEIGKQFRQVNKCYNLIIAR